MTGKKSWRMIALPALVLLLTCGPLVTLTARAGGGGGRSHSSSTRSSRTYHSTHRPYRSSSHRSGYSGQLSTPALIAIIAGGLIVWFVVSRLKKKNLPPPES